MTKKLFEFIDVSLVKDNKEIIQNINFNVKEGEIVAIIGKSGCGKSTILRMVKNLLKPTSGKINYCQDFSADKITMVFQNFALFPWLTVEENVSIVLESKKLEQSIIDHKTNQIIKLIGLGGYEQAYPKELSGGMKQRLGIARALVMDPEMIVMDEPFSALDVLTANTLKADLIDLWSDNCIPLKSILLVTHSIEEAVLLADRIIILSAKPGAVLKQMDIESQRPRNIKDPEVIKYIENVYGSFIADQISNKTIKRADLYYRVPFFSSFYGLIEYISTKTEETPLALLDTGCNLNAIEIIAATEFLELLNFLVVNEHSVSLTPAGHMLAEADVSQRKKIFSEHLVRHLPIISYIRDTLKERPSRTAPKKRFLSLLEDKLSPIDAQSTLNNITHWGRYTELFFYNDRDKTYYL